MMSGQGKEVLVLLPNDDEFLREMQAYMKIESFLRKNTNAHLSQYESIKEAKRTEMRKRNENAKLYLTEALKEATIYVNGDIARLNARDVSTIHIDGSFSSMLPSDTAWHFHCAYAFLSALLL